MLLDFELTPQLTQYLRQQRWIDPDEAVLALEKPGEGNMNFVVRIITDRQRFIVKQARPWVQKYPQVAAPVERVGVEARFYSCIGAEPGLQSFMPTLKGYDAANFTLALEDLGARGDYTTLYQPGHRLQADELNTLIDFISALHALNGVDFPANTAMKTLNHEHIFRFPFDERTGFDLDTVQPGLAAIARPYQRHEALKTRVAALGDVYLQTGSVLLHGDYYPGSWLNVASGVKIIDPEFGFMGRAEFDLGVLIAHLKMAQNDPLIPDVLARYRQPVGFDTALMWGFAGTETLRRLMGLAQLPLALSLAEKEQLLAEAASFIV